MQSEKCDINSLMCSKHIRKYSANIYTNTIKVKSQ